MCLWLSFGGNMKLNSLLVLLQALFISGQSTSCWRDTACTGPSEPSFSGTWDQYNYSPSSRVVTPKRILTSGNHFSSDYLPGISSLEGNGSLLIFDFGQEVGGIASVIYSAEGAGNLGLAFSESTNFTGEWSDDSNGSFNPDGAVYGSVSTTTDGNYTVPDAQLRGGFRYLTLFITTTSTLQLNITNIFLELSFQPSWSNLQAYGGYFNSNDDLINKIWYAGAYTLQTNNIPPLTGRAWPILGSGWANDGDCGTTGTSVYVDGSKRDRTVWAGDLAVAVPSILVSTGDIKGVYNTLEALYNVQVSPLSYMTITYLSQIANLWRTTFCWSSNHHFWLRHLPHVYHDRNIRLCSLL